MTLDELNELDFSNVGDWPIVVKVVLLLLLCLLLGVAGYYLHIEEQYTQLERYEREEQDLRLEFERKQRKAASLGAYKAQLAEMNESFGAMLRQLPDKTEVADLLVDVSQTGLAAGLEFQLFEPQGESRREFYAELPIKIQVIGTYHQFGEFISGLSALPRIVTVHNIVITQSKTKGGSRGGQDEGKKLLLNAVVKTYRYLEEGDG